MQLSEEVQSLEDWIIEKRRYFHRHPELSFEEKETTAYLVEELKKMGLEPHTYSDYYGVWADIVGEKPGNKTVMLRADIDALPIREETGLSYASENENVMHACGHDNHMAMLLGAAKLLTAHRQDFGGTVRLLFQAAEESCHGAEYYVKAGLLDDVDAVYGCHVWATLDAPKINVVAGPRMSSCDNFTIEVKGVPAHGSAPNYGIDAIVTAAAIIMQLQTIVSRRNDPRDNLAITIGEIEGGPRFNIISDHVVMKGTVRTHSRQVREQVEEWIRNIVESVAKANGAEATLDYQYFPGVLYNDEKLAAIAANAVKKLYGEEGLGEHPLIMGSEDFSYFLEKVPGVYALVGIRNEEKGIIYQNHHSKFNVEETVLKRGAALYAQFAIDYLEERDK